MATFFPADEIKRKLFHLLSLIYILAYWLLPKLFVLQGLGIAIVVVLVGEMVRLKVEPFNRWLLSTLGGVHRARETNQFSGLPWTLMGSFLTILIFTDRQVVLASFLYLAFGDSCAALFGRMFGKHPLAWGKTLEGSLACFIVCLLLGLPLLGWQVALVGALAATLIEAIPWPLNDNFWMPLVSAASLTILIPLFPM